MNWDRSASGYCRDQEPGGDWEADTIIGKGHQQGIVTLVDRYSKFTLMKKVESKRAEEVIQAILRLLEPVKVVTRTITSDNGKEFTFHHIIQSKKLEESFFFARPYHFCDRGLNEHTNGLIREYFPKHQAFVSNDAIKCTSDDAQKCTSKVDRSIGYNGFSFSRSLADDKQRGIYDDSYTQSQRVQYPGDCPYDGFGSPNRVQTLKRVVSERL
ncbi:MAG: IS30 family transposase [Epsilonproteobacteria bacterium]|nr:IS30 family transposase [Campylobacterota bacterium]